MGMIKERTTKEKVTVTKVEDVMIHVDEKLRYFDEGDLLQDTQYFRYLPEFEVKMDGWHLISKSQVLVEKDGRYIFPSKDGNFYDVTSLVLARI